MGKYSLVDTYRHGKNPDQNNARFIFNPRKMTSNPSRNDYLLVSENLVGKAAALKFKIGPKIGINSDNDYLILNLYLNKLRKSRTERREFFRFPDYLLTDNKFTELLDSKIKAKLNQSPDVDKVLKTGYNKRNS